MKPVLSVPPNRIPKIYPTCPECKTMMRTILSTPFADGYHRRHRCRDDACGKSMYTLTSYHDGTIMVGPTPFKDRPLTEAEYQQREQWWVEEYFASTSEVTQEVPERMRLALNKAESERNEVDVLLVRACAAITATIQQMEGSDNGDQE